MTLKDQEIEKVFDGANKNIGFFERYLSLWVALCIVSGVAIGQFIPAVPNVLGAMSSAEVNLPIAVLIWIMIFPMMLQIDFKSIVDVRREPKGLTITLVVNWLIKFFSMFAVAWFFFTVVFEPFITPELQTQYLAGAVLLGAAPCTAMVFVWSYLTKGDAAYTLVQVAINDLTMLFGFAPIVILLLGIGDIIVPWQTVLLSVVLYIVIPLAAGFAVRTTLIKKHNTSWFNEEFLPRFGPVTMIGLLATLVRNFSNTYSLRNEKQLGLPAMTTSILLVDDDPTVLHCWERQLDDLGYEVVAAHGSAEATLQWADSGGRADLGLIDIGLPGLSGIDLIRSLRRCIPELQLLVLTVFDDTPTVLSAFRAGARGYLLKDISQAKLEAALLSVGSGGASMHCLATERLVTHLNAEGLDGLSSSVEELLTATAVALSRKLVEPWTK